jgi:hypothetical protein
MNRLAPLLLVSLVAATVAGCGSSSSRMQGAASTDPALTSSGGPAASEMTELCALQRRMVVETPENQQAMLEAHMQAAHGSVNPQSLALHRREMGHCSTR